MLNLNTSCWFDYQDFNDLGNDLLTTHENKNMVNMPIPTFPMVVLTIFGVPNRALIDTGSQITAISEEFYNYLSQHEPGNELPVSNVVLFTAIGRKSTIIRKQVAYNIFLEI